MTARPWALPVVFGLALVVAGMQHPTFAQAHNPFAVAGNEGSVAPGGIGGWLIAWQAHFYRLITGAVRSAKANGTAMWVLAGISFGYGVFHAAGPGHGKAVVASYMLANERALRQGAAISFLAALFQGLVAVAIVTLAAAALGATAQPITAASNVVEIASYVGVCALGAWLLWRKGRAFVAALAAGRTVATDNRSVEITQFLLAPESPATRHGCPNEHEHGPPRNHNRAHAGGGVEPQKHAHANESGCGHFHAPDPRILGERFSWRAAALTVFSAGARPCSGAILVLVFARAQGIYIAGIAAAFAMALGTALTTAALAVTAVLFKNLAARFAGGHRRELVVRAFEIVAAAVVLMLGLGLLTGMWASGA